MILGIKEDFSSNVTLDSKLKSIPDSGIYLNSGVHPSITVENLLAFLPNITFTISAWDSGTTYGVFSETSNKTDLVSLNNKIYESIKAGSNQNPEAADSEYWLETNMESLKIKSLIDKVKEKVYSDLSLKKRLVSNEYLYHEGSQTHTLTDDYAAWIFEPRGSDYVSIVLNEISLQKSGTTPVSVYVVNQDKLVTTLTVTPDEGRIKFQDINYTLSGKGRHIIAIDSTEVISDNATIDPLVYDGFVAYTGVGVGTSPEGATYTNSTIGNGLGFNVTAYFDGAKYISNNLDYFGEFVRAVFELITFQMFLHNSNNTSSRTQRRVMDEELLLAELKNTQMDSVISRYYRQLKKAKARLDKAYDTQLFDEDDEITITLSSI